MLKLNLLLLCASALASVPRVQKPFHSQEPHDLEQHFEEFIVTYGKQYAHEEEKKVRFEIFKQNFAKMNKKNSVPEETATFVINKFADLTIEEFNKFYKGFRVNSKRPAIAYENIKRQKDVPDEFDWRTKNVVTRVKDQKLCGSCWAFGSIGCVESAYALKHGVLKDLSEQQLVDCDHDDAGCDGGEMQTAIQYIVNAGGVEENSDYTYKATDGKCMFDKSKIKVKVTKMLPYNLTSEKDTKQLLIQNGPITIGVIAASFTDYGGGILKNCYGTMNDHSVLLVGYGKENGTRFWIIKNSWGEDWGEKGYIRVAYDKVANPCGMYNKDAAGAEVS